MLYKSLSVFSLSFNIETTNTKKKNITTINLKRQTEGTYICLLALHPAGLDQLSDYEKLIIRQRRKIIVAL